MAVFFELPDTERVLVEAAFWDIYYEHCSYFTLGSLARLFRRTGFEPRLLWKAYDDQYLMIEARPAVLETGPRLPEEDDLERTRRQVDWLRAAVGARIGGAEVPARALARRPARRGHLWGSGSKAVSYLTTLGVTDEVEAVVDINPHKHGKFLAGTGHEIVAPEALRRATARLRRDHERDLHRRDPRRPGAPRPAAGDQRAGVTSSSGGEFSATPCT